MIYDDCLQPVSKYLPVYASMSAPTLNYVSCPDAAGGHRMAYWQWGAASADHTVVCVHGLSRQGRDFDVLAQALARKASGRVDGFVVEGPTAGGHNAPPRGPLQLSPAGEPVSFTLPKVNWMSQAIPSSKTGSAMMPYGA